MSPSWRPAGSGTCGLGSPPSLLPGAIPPERKTLTHGWPERPSRGASAAPCRPACNLGEHALEALPRALLSALVVPAGEALERVEVELPGAHRPRVVRGNRERGALGGGG